MFRTLYLPVGLVLMLVVGLLWPAPGQMLQSISIAGVEFGQLVVIIIFFLSGYSLKLAHLWHNLNRPLPVLWAVAFNLLAAPVLALAVAKLFQVPEGVMIGLVTATAVPTTLSSAMIIASQSGGNSVLALVLTVILTTIGVVTTPFMVGLTLSYGADLDLSYWDLLIKLVMLVLIPLVLGYLAKKVIKKEGSSLFGYIASSGVILFVGMVVTQNSEVLWQLTFLEVLMLAALTLGLHLVLLGLGMLGGIVLALDGPSALSLGLCTGQKTLPVAMTVLLALENSGIDSAFIAEAAIICVLFHLLQIIADSLLAPWLARRLGIPQATT